MYAIRNAILEDIPGLIQLANTGSFLSLSPDRQELERKILRSHKSFSSPDRDLSKNDFFFVLVSLKGDEEFSSGANSIIGTSQIHPQHGNQSQPHYYFQVRPQSFESKRPALVKERLQLQLKFQSDGPTEVGGLVVHPDFRGHPYKLGQALSYVRFDFLSQYPHLFKNDLLVEVMPACDQNQQYPFWEAVGKKFTGLPYQVANDLSLSNKDFIKELFPLTPIEVCLLSEEVQACIGKVHPNARPVMGMLKKLGFEEVGEIDPFDGGPHLRAKKEVVMAKWKELERQQQKKLPWRFARVAPSEKIPYQVRLEQVSSDGPRKGELKIRGQQIPKELSI